MNGSRRNSIAGEFGDSRLGAVIVNQRLASGSRGDERGKGGFVERAAAPG